MKLEEKITKEIKALKLGEEISRKIHLIKEKYFPEITKSENFNETISNLYCDISAYLISIQKLEGGFKFAEEALQYNNKNGNAKHNFDMLKLIYQ